MALLLLLALAGALGTLARHGIHALLPSGPGHPVSYPVATFAVNVLGCFLVGLLASAAGRDWLRPGARDVLAAGFCGGFTTFSAYGLQAALLAREGSFGVATAYLLLSNLLGLLAAALGLWMGGARG